MCIVLGHTQNTERGNIVQWCENFAPKVGNLLQEIVILFYKGNQRKVSRIPWDEKLSEHLEELKVCPCRARSDEYLIPPKGMQLLKILQSVNLQI